VANVHTPGAIDAYVKHTPALAKCVLAHTTTSARACIVYGTGARRDATNAQMRDNPHMQG